jgi:hypothetical protein
MVRTGILALGAALLALALASQANAAVGVAAVHHEATSQVQQIGLKKKAHHHHHHHKVKKHKKHKKHHLFHKKHH